MRWTRKGFEEDAAEAKVENWSGNGARPAEWFRAPTQWFYGPTQWLRGPTQWFYAPTRRVVTYAFFVTIGATTPARSEETCADSTCAIAEAPTAVASVASIASSAIAPARRIVVDLPARTLTLYENGRATHVYPAAVGRESTPTPSGSFTIINRLSDPVYYGAGTVVPPGPTNPLGDHWLGLSRKGYGIHGTNQPGSIGKAASHGCIRLARKDLKELFGLVRVGDEVDILDPQQVRSAA